MVPVNVSRSRTPLSIEMGGKLRIVRNLNGFSGGFEMVELPAENVRQLAKMFHWFISE